MSGAVKDGENKSRDYREMGYADRRVARWPAKVKGATAYVTISNPAKLHGGQPPYCDALIAVACAQVARWGDPATWLGEGYRLQQLVLISHGLMIMKPSN